MAYVIQEIHKCNWVLRLDYGGLGLFCGTAADS